MLVPCLLQLPWSQYHWAVLNEVHIHPGLVEHEEGVVPNLGIGQIGYVENKGNTLYEWRAIKVVILIINYNYVKLQNTE
jgi:hypothetical protein